MSAPPAQTLAAHLLNQTLSSIALLEQLSVITSSDAHAIRSKLPSPTGPFPSLHSQSDVSSPFHGLSVSQPDAYALQRQGHQGFQQGPSQSGPPSLPPRGRPGQRAKALWDYTGAEQDDLSFRQGDTLIIDEEVNEQWYRGRVVPQGQSYPLEKSGLFPSNYIEKQQLQQPPQQQQSPPFYQNQQQPPSQMVPYQPPGPPQPYGYDNKQPMVYQNPPPPQHMMHYQQQPQSVVAHEEEKKNKFGKIGGQLGNAAVNGAGFGFGASIASNVVNKIF